MKGKAQGDAFFELDRRSVCKSLGAGIAGTTIIGSADVGADSPDSKLVFNDQRSDGKSVVIAKIEVEVERGLHIFDTDRNLLNNVENIAAGQTLEDYEVKLANPISESQVLIAELVGGDQNIKDRALVTVGEDPSDYTGVSPPKLFEADPDQGFNYPYLLFAPSKSSNSDPVPILVQPNNTGATTDNFDRHLERAQDKMEDGSGRHISDQLSVPLLIPVFPRPQSEPVDWTHYVHALDVTTLQIDGGPLERVDLQLISMVRDAQNRLKEQDYPVKNKIMLNGFSAAGTFVNRFAALHPDIVISVTAGGVNGMPLLPLEEARGYTLPYHIGVANVEELIGEPFDLEAFRNVPQFLYIGELEPHDTIPYSDAWTNRDLAQLALTVYGDDPVDERMRYSNQVYDKAGIPAVFRIYDDKGHNPHHAKDHIVEFHRRIIAGEDIGTLQAKYDNVSHLNAAIDYKPETPRVGEQVAFDGTSSSVRGQEIVGYTWEFSRAKTADGPLVSHTFEEVGGHNVQLTVEDNSGRTYSAVEQIIVVRSDQQTESPTRTETARVSTPTSIAGESNTTSAAAPGFGIMSALVGVGGAAYLLRNR